LGDFVLGDFVDFVLGDFVLFSDNAMLGYALAVGATTTAALGVAVLLDLGDLVEGPLVDLGDLVEGPLVDLGDLI